MCGGAWRGVAGDTNKSSPKVVWKVWLQSTNQSGTENKGHIEIEVK